MKKSDAVKKILIVEDDATSALLLQKLVKDFGYGDTEILASGEAAVARVQECRPDLLLMDITLTGKMDGIEAAERIIAEQPLPLVYLTASTDDETINRAKKTMPHGYVLKPYDKNMVHAAIEMALYKFETEQKLIESEKRNRDILSSIPDVMFTLDAEGNFVYDYEADIARRIWPQKVSSVALPQIRKVFEGSDAEDFDYALKRPDGASHFEARIFRAGEERALVIVRDITKRKQTELELQDYKQHLENLVQERTSELSTEQGLRLKIGEDLRIFSHAIGQSPNLVVFFDREGTVQYVNAKFVEVSGYEPDEVIGSNVNKPGNYVVPEPEIWSSIVGAQKWVGEIYNVNRQKELYYLQAIVSSIRGDGGKISHYVLVAEDITAAKKEQMALDSVKQALEKGRTEKRDLALDWHEWKEKMLSRNISRTDKSLFRNINNSFTQGAGFGTLITLLDLLAQGAEKKEGGKYLVDGNIFDLMLSNVRTAQNAFKTFSNIDWIINNDFQLETVSFYDFMEVVKAAVDNVRDLCDIHGHKIVINEHRDQHRNAGVNLNREYFFKALCEILVNALKFSRYNTFIVVMVTVANRFLTLSIVNDPDRTDEGFVGIPAEYEKVVFEPFYRLTKNVYEQYRTLDFGLGLTLVEKIVQKHGGEVLVENVRDHSDLRREPQLKVNVSISLPVKG